IGKGSNTATYGNTSMTKHIFESGNVGIGTENPNVKLTIATSSIDNIDVRGGHIIGLNDTPSDPSHAVPLGYLQDNYGQLLPGGASSTWVINGSNIYNNNYATGNVGIGTNNPQTMLTLGNNGWLSAINSTNTGHINMFRVNTSNQIEVGGPLLINQFQFATDSGYNTFVDMPVTAAATLDSVQGYALRVDGENLLTIYSESNGAGGIKNKRIGINVTNPDAADLDINGYMRTQGINVKSFVSAPGIVMADTLGNLSSSPGFILKTTYVNDADYLVGATDSIIAYSAITTNRTVSIPDSLCTTGRFFVIMDQSGSSTDSAQIIIDPAGTTPIVGNSTFSLAGPYNAVYIFCGKPAGTPAWFLL
ncbi:hypothetical protein GW934_01540, partial [Candidatus Falkowbacteria bacterium]|nr:hypothetical protein [Candidatus Falkowbacteria bacterium]